MAFCGQSDNPTELFLRYVEQDWIDLSMDFYKAGFVQVGERGYTILESITDTSSPCFFQEVKAPFCLAEDP